jgi:hypothetical protein
MKFILTVYICSLLSGECVIPQDKEAGFNYPKEYGSHFGCVRDGLGESKYYLTAIILMPIL